MLEDPPLRVQRAERVLEDHLQRAPRLEQPAALQADEVVALEAHRARLRPRRLQHRARERRLARAGLADHAERLAGAHVEGDVGDGLHHAALHAAVPAHLELLHDVARGQQRLVAVGAHAASSHGNQHAQRWPGEPSSSGGAVSRHMSCAFGQRGENGQPGGQRGQVGRTARRPPAAACAAGARRAGWRRGAPWCTACARGRRARASAPARPRARRTSRRPRRRSWRPGRGRG